jgi:hypothetical protein
MEKKIVFSVGVAGVDGRWNCQCGEWNATVYQSCNECGRLCSGMEYDFDDGNPITRTFEPKERDRSFATIATEIGATVTTKNKAYGDSFAKSGQVLRTLYPDGIPPEKMDDALTIVRVLDKLFRIATDRDALGESPWRDIAGYAVLAIARGEK